MLVDTWQNVYKNVPKKFSSVSVPVPNNFVYVQNAVTWQNPKQIDVMTVVLLITWHQAFCDLYSKALMQCEMLWQEVKTSGYWNVWGTEGYEKSSKYFEVFSPNVTQSDENRGKSRSLEVLLGAEGVYLGRVSTFSEC